MRKGNFRKREGNFPKPWRIEMLLVGNFASGYRPAIMPTVGDLTRAFKAWVFREFGERYDYLPEPDRQAALDLFYEARGHARDPRPAAALS